MKFVVRLKTAHDLTGLSAYAVGKQTGIPHNTIQKYISQEEVEVRQLWSVIVQLANYYGVDWRDPEIIGVVEEGEVIPEMKTPLAEIA